MLSLIPYSNVQSYLLSGSEGFSIQLVDLLLEHLLGDVSLDLEGGGEEIILDGEGLRVQVDLLDLLETGERVLFGLFVELSNHYFLELV